MSQHFLLSSAAKTLSLAQVFRMTDEQAEEGCEILADVIRKLPRQS